MSFKNLQTINFYQKAFMLLLSTSLFLSACDKDSGQRKRPAQQSPGSVTHEHDNLQKNADGTPKNDSAKNADGKDPKNPSNPNDSANKNPNDPQSPKTDNLDPNGNNQQLTVNSNNNGNNPPVVPSGGFPPNPAQPGNFAPGGNSPTVPLSQSDSRSTPRNGNSTATQNRSANKDLEADVANDEILNRKKKISNKSKSIEIELNGDDEEKDADDETIADQDEESENSTIKKLKDNNNKGIKGIYKLYLFLYKMNKIYLNSWMAINNNKNLRKDKNIFNIIIEKIKKQKLIIIHNEKVLKYDESKNCSDKSIVINHVSNTSENTSENYFQFYQLQCDKIDDQIYKNGYNLISNLNPFLEFSRTAKVDDTAVWKLEITDYHKIMNKNLIENKEDNNAIKPICNIEMDVNNNNINKLDCEYFYQLYKNKQDKHFVRNFNFEFFKNSDDSFEIKTNAKIIFDDLCYIDRKVENVIFSFTLKPTFEIIDEQSKNCQTTESIKASSLFKNYTIAYPNRSIASERLSYQNHLSTNEVEEKVKKKVNLKEKRNM